MRALRTSLLILAFQVNICFGFIQSQVFGDQSLKFVLPNNRVVIDYDLSGLNIDSSVIDSFLFKFSDEISSSLGIELSFSSASTGSSYKLITSNDTSVFSSSSIAAVTKISFEDTGDIISSEIIINLNVDLSDDSMSFNYFGNVISHEVGHMLGLDHSTSWGSSMAPNLTPGQHTWEADDISGALFSLGLDYKYPGVISGVVVGGDEEKRIYGSNVDLIDFESMKVVQSQVSNRNGEFEFVNVDKSKKYIIGYGPFDFSSSYRDEYLSSFKSFCHGREDYVYTILSSCYNSYEDIPTVLQLTDDNLSIDKIGIKCDLSSDKFLYDYTINSKVDNEFLQNYDFSDERVLLKGLSAYEQSISLPLNLSANSSDTVLRVSLLSQLSRSPFFVSGQISNNSTSQETTFGEDSLQTINNFTFPSDEGVPNFNFSEFVYLNTGDNDLTINLDFISKDSFLEDAAQALINEDFLYSGPANELGSFIIGLELGKINSEGIFESSFSDRSLYENDYFSCSSANNSFEIPEPPEQLSTGSNRSPSSGGCNLIASEGNGDNISIYSNSIWEILFLVFIYVAIRRLTLLIF